MNIEFEKSTSDYPDGALKIYARSHEEAFKLGEMFSDIYKNGYETVCGSVNGVWIRVPLNKRED